MDWAYGHRTVRALFRGAQYQDVADTIVQLTRRSTSGVMAPSQPWSKATQEEGMTNQCRKQPWKPHEKHGQLTTQSDFLDSVYAFPKQRKEPLTDAQHVRNAVARFDQVIDVSDADRALAFAEDVREKAQSGEPRGNVMARSGHSSSKRREVSLLPKRTPSARAKNPEQRESRAARLMQQSGIERSTRWSSQTNWKKPRA